MKINKSSWIFVFLFLASIISASAVVQNNSISYILGSSQTAQTCMYVNITNLTTTTTPLTKIYVNQSGFETLAYIYNNSKQLEWSGVMINNIATPTVNNTVSNNTAYYICSNSTVARSHLSKSGALPVINQYVRWLNGSFALGALEPTAYAIQAIELGSSNNTISLSVPSEIGIKYLPQNTIAINASTDINGFANMTIYVYNSLGIYYQYNTTNSTQYINVTVPMINATYYYNATAYNTSGYRVNTTTNNINISYANLNVTAANYSGTVISTFNVSANGTLYTTTNGTASIPIILGYTYTLNFTNLLYATMLINYTANQSINQSLNIILYPSNSINITIYDETNATIINSSTTHIYLYGTTTSYSYTTINGTLLVSNITAGQYSIVFTNGNYSARTYIITVSNSSTQNLNAYLALNYQSTVFTYTDSSNGASLGGVMGTMYTFVNGTWQAVESQISDPTGRIQWLFIPNSPYMFLSTLSNYTDKSFTLSPILFTNYNVQMIRAGSAISSDVNIYYAPVSLTNNQSNNFAWMIQSYNGLLTNYGFNLTSTCYNNGTSGNQANGQVFTMNFSLNSSCSPIDTILLTSWYNTSLGEYTINYAHLNIYGTVNTYTFLSNQNNQFGLGDFERTLIVVMIVLVVGGVAGMLGGMIIGMAIGLFILAYFSLITSFINPMAAMLVLIVGIVLLISRMVNST